MTEAIETIAISVVTAVITSLIIGHLATRRAVHRMKRERRWNARYEAYEKIFSALHVATSWADAEHLARSGVPLPVMPAPERKDLFKKAQDAIQELSRFAQTAGLVMSDASQEELQNLLRDNVKLQFDAMETPEESSEGSAHYYENVHDLFAARVPKLQTLARADLA